MCQSVKVANSATTYHSASPPLKPLYQPHTEDKSIHETGIMVTLLSGPIFSPPTGKQSVRNSSAQDTKVQRTAITSYNATKGFSASQVNLFYSHKSPVRLPKSGWDWPNITS